MYREYKKKCENYEMIPARFEKYRLIFREYCLSFHKPKKDLCKRCVTSKEMSDEEKKLNGDAHVLHLKRRDDARKCRDEDKEEAKSNESTLAFNFDLEAVLNTPKGATGPFFYVRKLAVYNLTVYNLGNQDVACFLWDETQGKCGSVEISTCIHNFIMEKQNILQVKMSDGCGEQQKNYHFCSMCLLTVQQHPTLQVIDHNFFESGHTHMECDSIHSKIEAKAKNIPVYTPDGWAQIISLARNNPPPYEVTHMQHDEFLDFGSQNRFQPYVENNKKIALNDAVWVQFRENDPTAIFIKTSFDQQDFYPLKLRKRRGKAHIVKTAYSQIINISVKKKQDLMNLCKDLQIPKFYHNFYENLPSSEVVREALPEPDFQEDSQ